MHDDDTRSPTDGPRHSDVSQARKAAFASTVGSAIEWYDFYVYGLSAALIFNKLFFPGNNPYSGTLLALSTFFAGFAVRPIGALIFGHFGDRLGRRKVLIATMTLMGAGTFFVGLTPTHAVIGIWGAVILVVLRVVQGIGVGGDWGGSVLLATEWKSAKGKRGFMGSLPQFGSPLGLIIATIVTEGSSRFLSNDAFESWGWRLPFLASLVLTAIGLYLRLRVVETASFEQAKNSGALRKAPLAHLLRYHWRTVLGTTLMRAGQHASFYLFTTFVLSFGVTSLHQPRSTMLLSVMLAAAISLGTTLFWGSVSDRIGRKRMLQIGLVVMFCFAIPYYGLLTTGSLPLIVIAIVLSLVVHDMQYGPQSSFIAESFPPDVRYSGSSLGYQLSSVTAGGPAALVATAFMATFNSTVPIAIYLMVMCAVAFVALLLLPSVDDPGKVGAESKSAAVPAKK
ncbi:MFS transporter [Saccharopolyspora phatthalungensis]|uniref:MFS family permease n=1 Tax=Saccharopolyspora phatthalungensis TaxID=664693 RepID=A0A840QHZ2_9PSEU|nr:MFS transporter [Saccharopolyspora phatthalungensis]MBB5159670.1 MFS family permease [Saccharopolyspora phatthalungensis]